MIKICKQCNEIIDNCKTRQKYHKECKEEAERERVKNYRKEIAEISKEIGNCTCCGKPKLDERYSTCFICRKRVRDSYRLHK